MSLRALVCSRLGAMVFLSSWMRPPNCRHGRIASFFIAEGADLVIFSGGKAIDGPQGTGILCGKRELVASAALQMVDLDVPFGRPGIPPEAKLFP